VFVSDPLGGFYLDKRFGNSKKKKTGGIDKMNYTIEHIGVLSGFGTYFRNILRKYEHERFIFSRAYRKNAIHQSVQLSDTPFPRIIIINSPTKAFVETLLLFFLVGRNPLESDRRAAQENLALFANLRRL